MTTITARCEICGNVQLAPGDVLIVTDNLASPSFRFCCPLCATTVERPIDRKVLMLLNAAGCPHEYHELERFGLELDATNDLIGVLERENG